MLRQRSGTIIIVVVVALSVGYSVHTAVESRRTQAVARAIEEYMAVRDAEWVDADCMPDHCPKSSKSLPDLYRITLAPSVVDKHNYVVMDDEYLNPTKYRPGPGGVAIYYRDNGRKPQCFG